MQPDYRAGDLRRMPRKKPATSLLEQSHQLRDASDELAVPLVHEHTDLCDQRVGGAELSNGKARDGELADAENSDPKLRNCQDTAGELTDRDNAPGHHGHSVRPVLERDMNQRQAKYLKL